MRFALDPSSPDVQQWAAGFAQQLLSTYPLAAGLFVDNSNGIDPAAGSSVLESHGAYTADYSALLAAVDRAIAPKWIMASTMSSGTQGDQVAQEVQATFDEATIRALTQTAQQFTSLASSVADRLGAAGSPRYLVLDSVSTGGSETDPRTQMATLASYYLMGNPQTTFLMLWGGENPSSNWSNHFFNALTYNVGQPLGTYSVFATGQDPSNTKLSYTIYQRQYSNALVLYKPLSSTPGLGSGTTADNTATTHQLNGNYRLVNADGTLGPVITQITLRNGEGAVLIKA
jgi:hypothetical protein